MLAISEPNVLLRVPGKLPKGLKLPTEEFQEGWNLARSIDACRLETKIQARKWNFIKIANGLTRSGVGDTSQDAIASALRHALRGISEDSNAVEIKHIELTKYPWSFWPGSESVPIEFSETRRCRHPKMRALFLSLPPQTFAAQSTVHDTRSVSAIPR